MSRVLLCDDSPMSLKFLERRVTENGHEVVAKGRDGEEGYQLYQQYRPDFVLLDITMPNKDGRECLRDIMKFDPSAKVIMVTGLVDAAIAEECRRLGAIGFVEKGSVQSGDGFRNNVIALMDQCKKAA